MNKFFSILTLTTGTALAMGLIVKAPIPLRALAQTSIDSTTFLSNALSAHNTYRVKHHSPNMTISESLNSTAQAWAQHLATSNVGLQHSSRSQRNNAGENLFVYYTTAPSFNSADLGKSAVKSWYDESSLYNYANPVFSSATGHFTQVVWKNSTQLGCGAAPGKATVNGRNFNAFYVVCHYAPAGNVQGQFASNVLTP
ncbi:CAP family protein [Floridanema aerugineum]|uniref:CAP family protein n=1 Tax=Floridaenema aerugineum BLCC-F46 TaxID=3153654 RepID=A0ABV4XD67_9CYAN